MRIRKARFVDPEANGAFGRIAVAASMFIFAYSTHFGPIAILTYYAFWLPLVLIDYRHSLGNYAKFVWILAFAGLAILSVFWSAAPSTTARSAIQYASHVVCALIAARTIGIRTLSQGVLIGILFVLLYSLAFGTDQYDALDTSYSFVGAFESKNQLGFYASLGLYFAVGAAIVLRERGLWMAFALLVGALSVYCLAASNSATSVIATIAALLVTLGFAAALLVAPTTRRWLFFGGVAMAALTAFVFLNAGGIAAVLDSLGKDPTLTGRTYLWAEGLAAWREAPILGVGYQAYWVPGFPEAERLWSEFHVSSGSGFHFHNTAIETAVELGAVGVSLLAIVMLRAVLGHVWRLVSDRRNRVSHMMAGLAFMLLVRSFSETDVLTSYTVGAFFLYYAAGLLATSQKTRYFVELDSEDAAAFQSRLESTEAGHFQRRPSAAGTGARAG